MRVIVFGARGMLGEQVVSYATQAGYTVIAPDIDIADHLDAFAYKMEPDRIINCAGKRPGAPLTELIHSNAVGPHMIAATFDCPILHVSTDCVFEGDRTYNYFIDDKPDAKSIYGRSKALGEVDAPHVANIRTSFIGPKHGFLRWLLDSKEVEGWTQAIWSGSTVQEVARTLVGLLPNPPHGIQHMATLGNISKHDLIKHIITTLDLNITITPRGDKMIWRGLRPTIIIRPVKELTDDLNSAARWARTETQQILTRVSNEH